LIKLLTSSVILDREWRINGVGGDLVRGKKTAWIIVFVVLLLTNIFVVGIATSNGVHPVARFTYSLPSQDQDPDPIVYQVITFDASSSTPNGGDIPEPDGYFWNFNDSTTATGKVVTHAYSWPSLTPVGAEKAYNVTLTVTDTEGLSDTTWKTISVFPFLRVNPPIRNSTDGIKFNVTVNVVQIKNLYSWQFEIDFNPSVLNVTKFYWGPFLRTVATTWRLGPYINNTAGWVSASELYPPPPQRPSHGADGTGTLATITFQVKSVGATLLQFNNEKTLLSTLISGVTVYIRHERFDGVFDSRTSNQPPTASFTAPLVANRGEEISFDASSSNDPDGWLVSYLWDLGDGTPQRIYMRELNPSLGSRNINLTDGRLLKHLFYTVTGVYTATLTVTDNNGTTATTTRTFTIQGHDIAVTKIKSQYIAVMPGIKITIDVTVANNGYPYTETFDVTAYASLIPIGSPQQVIDMQPKTETTLTFIWDTTDVPKGQYLLKANATKVAGDYDTINNEKIYGIITIANTIILPPKEVTIGGRTFYLILETSSPINTPLDFSQENKKITFTVGGADGTVGFSNVTIPNDLLEGPYTVYFDGDSPTILDTEETTNGTHTFLYFTYTHSTHTVEIIGSNVATPPLAIFTPSTTRAIANTPINFDATDSSARGTSTTIETYQWDFDDGTITTENEPTITHKYASAGTYTVTLTVKDDKQLTNSTQASITIIDYPQAKFQYSPHPFPLVNKTITFTASDSKPKGGEITSYKWDFDDGTTATEPTPITTHNYTAVGKYSVVLNVTDNEGLWNTETQDVTIYMHNIAITDLTATPNTVKIGQLVTINITVANQGNFTETFDVNAYYDNMPIENREVTMDSEAPKTITIIWNTTNISPATYTIKANATTDAEETETDDNTKIGNSVTIQKWGTQLSVSALPTTLTIGENTTISGTINITRSGVSIIIQYKFRDETWNNITTVTTDAQGSFLHKWKPEKAGTYEVKAKWLGDATTLPSESNTQQITVNEPPTPINLLYIVAATVVIIALASVVYFLKIKKPKTK